MDKPTDSIFDNAMGLEIAFKKPGVRRKVNADRITTDADRSMLHVGKDIIDSDEFRNIVSFDSGIKRYLQAIALPSVLRSGTYLVPFALVENVDAKLEEFGKQRLELVEQFIEAYPAQKAAAVARLAGLYNEGDYPTVAQLRESFAMITRYVGFDVPGKLKSISKHVFEKAKERAETEWISAITEMQNTLRAKMEELVTKMVEALETPTEDGKKKKWFKDSRLENLQEFIQIFDFKNITNDTELAQIVGQAKQLLSGVDADAFRNNDITRFNLTQGFDLIKETLKDMVVAKPARKLKFTAPAVPTAVEPQPEAILSPSEPSTVPVEA